jgi:hypothetical protein
LKLDKLKFYCHSPLSLSIIFYLISRCACAEGELSKDEKHCHDSSAFLAYAFGKDIRFLHLKGVLHQAPYQPITSASPTVALDFDFEEKLIFFSLLSKSIMRVHFNGSGLTEISINCKFYYSNRELATNKKLLYRFLCAF